MDINDIFYNEISVHENDLSELKSKKALYESGQLTRLDAINFINKLLGTKYK